MTECTMIKAVAMLTFNIAADQAFDHDRALTHYRGLLGRIEDQRFEAGKLDLLDRLDHNIEDLMTDEEFDAELGKGRR